MRLLVSTLILAGLLPSCGYQRMKGSEAANDRAGVRASDPVSFETVQRLVIGPRCLSCHSAAGGNSGGTNLEGFEAVRSLAKRVEERSLRQRNMPPSGALAETEARILQAWLTQGAPLEAKRVGEETVAPVEPGWKAVRDRVLGPRCVECHSQPDPVGGLDLNDLAQVRGKAGRIFERAVIARDMPPERELHRSEIEGLSRWIIDGMPE